MSSKVVQLRQVKIVRNATSGSNGRRGNDAYRIREHLTEAEMDKLLSALKRNRHGHRDCLIGLLQRQQQADGIKGLTCSSMSAPSPSAAWALDA
jgi:hypothetical protein